MSSEALQILNDPNKQLPDRSRWHVVNKGGGQYKLLPKKREFINAAQTSRLTEDWNPSQLDFQSLFSGKLQRLINRSRDLEVNNEYVSGFLLSVENNIIGPDNFPMLEGQVEDRRGGMDTLANDAIEKAFIDFSKKEFFTTTKRYTRNETEKIGVRSAARDGACLFKKVTGKAAGNKYNFALQPLEVDYLDENLNENLKNGNVIRMGVEYNPVGAVVNYHLHTNHPGSSYDTNIFSGRKYEQIPVNEIIHPFVSKRFSQSRGYPWMVSSMFGLRMLLGYKDAEILAARSSAAKGGFFTSDGSDEFLGDDAPDGGKYLDADPLSFPTLPQGYRFEQFDPNHPSTAFGPFVKESIRGIAASVGMTYHNFAADLEGVNYTSSRTGLLSERDMWICMQGWWFAHFTMPVFESWLEAALLSGQVLLPNGSALPLSGLDRFKRVFFQGRRWDWVDPNKDGQAAKFRIDNNMSSEQREAKKLGVSYEQILKEKKEARELREKYQVDENVENPTGEPDPELTDEEN
jgi:lambda family phage portal protein